MSGKARNLAGGRQKLKMTGTITSGKAGNFAGGSQVDRKAQKKPPQV